MYLQIAEPMPRLREAKLLTHPPKFAIDKLRLKASFTRKFLTATACQFFL